MKGLLCALVFVTGALAEVPGVHSVYILPMSGGLDQYLAEQLTRDHVLKVVADPKTADAVITDQLGEAFETRMAKIHPRAKEDKDSGDVHPSFRSTGSRGTVFLVNATSRQVLWSAYQKAPRSHSAGMLNREAEKIAKKLQTDFAK